MSHGRKSLPFRSTPRRRSRRPFDAEALMRELASESCPLKCSTCGRPLGAEYVVRLVELQISARRIRCLACQAQLREAGVFGRRYGGRR